MMPILPQQMATGGGAPAPQQPSDIEGVRKQLFDFIKQQLNAPTPQAPQYQQTPLTPTQGFALARNPQAAGQMMQYQQAPAQANYMQQQAAFEGAMAGRHQALQTGTALLGQEQKQQMNPLELARYLETVRHNQAMEGRPGAASKPREMLTTHPDGTQWIFNLDTNQERPAGGAAKPPTEATVTARTSFETTKENLKLLKNMALASGTSLGERFGATMQRGFSHIPGNEMFSSQANVNDYNAIVNDLGTQLRAVYGAQGIRAIQEIQLLLKNLPPYGSAPELIEQRFGKIESIINKLEQERQRLQPNVFPSGAIETPEQKKARIKAKYGLP